jgi:hypothetical protein
MVAQHHLDQAVAELAGDRFYDGVFQSELRVPLTVATAAERNLAYPACYPCARLPEIERMRGLDRGSRVTAALGNGILTVAMACLAVPAAQADSLPPSVRACAQEPDSLKRLVCFDREVARYNDQATAAAGKAVPIPPPVPVPPASALSGSAQAPSAAATAPAQDSASPASPPKHISAHVVSVENFPDAIVVHLDNGQVWQQIQEATGTVGLRAGDTVTIDREMAAYWLSGKDGVAVKVRQKVRK